MIEIIQLLKDTKLEACIDNRSPFSFTRTGARESIFPTTRDKAYLRKSGYLFQTMMTLMWFPLREIPLNNIIQLVLR